MKKTKEVLLTPFARKHALEQSVGGDGFWKSLAKAYQRKEDSPAVELPVPPQLPARLNRDDLRKLGYRPFCRVNELTLSVALPTDGKGKGIGCVLRDGTALINQSVRSGSLGLFGEDSHRTSLLARLYLAAVTDDGEIDDQEARALGAVARLLNLNRDEQANARKIAYGILLRQALLDGHLSLSEKRSLSIAKDVFKVTEEEGAAIFSVLFGDRMREAGVLGLLAKDCATRFRRLAKSAKLPASQSKPILASIADSLCDQELAEGVLPEPVRSPLKLKRGEHCRYRSKVTVSTVAAEISSTILRIGGLALETDGFCSLELSKNCLVRVGKGELFLTDDRLVFRTGKKSVTTRLERVTGLKRTTAGILVRCSGTGDGRVYQVEDPDLFHALVVALHDRRVPESRLGPDRAVKLRDLGPVGEQILDACRYRDSLQPMLAQNSAWGEEAVSSILKQIESTDKLIENCRSVYTDTLLASYFDSLASKSSSKGKKKRN